MPRSKESKACLHDRVLNPSSGRCVIKSGRIGKRLLSQSNSKPSKSSKATNPKPPRDCASDKIVNPSSGRCVKKSGRIGKVLLNGERPEGTSASSADALLVATERLLKRIGKRVGDLQPPKSMLLKMSQVNRIRKKQLVLPVVAPQDYDKATMLTAFSEDISEDFFYEDHRGVAVTGKDVWWVITPQLVAWLEKKAPSPKKAPAAPSKPARGSQQKNFAAEVRTGRDWGYLEGGWRDPVSTPPPPLPPSVTARQAPQAPHTVQVRNEQYRSLTFFPDPRGDTWTVPLMAEVIDGVLDPENIAEVLHEVAVLQQHPARILPRLEILKVENQPAQILGGTGIKDHIPALKEGEIGIGPVTYRWIIEYEGHGHRVCIVVTNIDDQLNWYLVDPNGRMDEQWGKRMPRIIEAALRHILGDAGLNLRVFDTLNRNFVPSDDTLRLLEERFGLKVPKMGVCMEVSLIYAVEMICTVALGPDADRLTRFINRDLLRRTTLFTTEGLSAREEAELLLYSRALAWGIFKYLTLKAGVHVDLESVPKVTVRRTLPADGVPRLKRVAAGRREGGRHFRNRW